MAAIDQYIERITDESLKEQIQMELARLMKKKSFGLVFEHHMPDNLLMPEVPIRRGTNVVIRNGKVSDVYEVQSLTDTGATCIQLSTMSEVVLPLADLVAIAQRGDVIYPYLKPMDSVKNALDSELWHTLIEADTDIEEIAQRLRIFNRERDWEQFHDAKNLALSISIEASELNECFLWKSADEADRAKIEEELADVFLCAIMLADKYNFNVKDICLKKIERNAQKYPVEKAKGKATKYDEL